MKNIKEQKNVKEKRWKEDKQERIIRKGNRMVKIRKTVDSRKEDKMRGVEERR